MKVIKLLGAYICAISILLGCADKDSFDPEALKQRTVLMYLVADNNISGDIYENINGVEKGLKETATPGTFLIYWDGPPTEKLPTPALLKYEVYGKGKVSKQIILKTYPEQNSALPSVLATVLSDAKRSCPAENYGFIMGSHATGWLPIDYRSSRAIGQDNGGTKYINDWMDVVELGKTLTQSGIHFDYILFDACHMSQIEIAYEMRHLADYIIASPAEVLSEGFPYATITKYLMAVGNIEENAINVAKGFANYYRANDGWATIAVIKTSELEQLTNLTAQIMAQYKDNLANFRVPNKADDLQNRYGYARFDLKYSAYDFRTFMFELTQQNLSADFDKQLNQTIVYKDFVDDYRLPGINISNALYSGIGCYIPGMVVNGVSFSNWESYFSTLSWRQAVWN